MKYLRKVKGVTRLDRIRNEQIRNDLAVEGVEEYVQRKQLDWWGHLNRMRDNIPVKKVWQSKTPWKRQPGRPRDTWDGAIAAILAARGVTWQEARDMSRDRDTWKRFIGGKEDGN